MHYWQGNKEEFSEERLIATAKTLFKTCQLSTTNVLPQDYIHTLNPPASILLISDARRHKVVAVTLWWLEDACFWGVSGHKPCLVGTLVVILLVNASLLPAAVNYESLWWLKLWVNVVTHWPQTESLCEETATNIVYLLPHHHGPRRWPAWWTTCQNLFN